MFGTALKDSHFVANHFIGAKIAFPMQNADDVLVLCLRDCRQCEWKYICDLPRLLQGFGMVCSEQTQLTCFPTVSLDHGLYARATASFRGEARHDFIERLMVDLQDREYSHYDRLVALIAVFDPVADVSCRLAIVEPFEEVCQLVLPRGALQKVKARIECARQRLTSRIYDRSDGQRRLGRPYVLRDPYGQSSMLVAVETILAASHFIQDFATPDCYYVADTTFYYR
jgi:hypothetical protein